MAHLWQCETLPSILFSTRGKVQVLTYLPYGLILGFSIENSERQASKPSVGREQHV